jgi:outer membrane protein OmpA-like peptidoglycan-associated protein
LLDDGASGLPRSRAALEGERSVDDLSQLRDLLVGRERREIDDLRRRLDALEPSADKLADHLPQAIALRTARDRQLAIALAPTVEGALSESVRRNPREIATAIFPVLGPAIRKAIAETMAGLVNSINQAFERSLTPEGLRWRAEAWRTGVPFAQVVIKHSLLYKVEQVFVIHAETGLLLAHAAAGDRTAHDADLVSGMLTAIRDFVADSFDEKDSGGLRTFSVGELNVVVEAGPRAYIAAVVRGLPPESFRIRLQTTLERLHLQYARALSTFSGDSAVFASAVPLLEECLETVLTTERRAGATGVRYRWLVPAVIVGLLGLFAVRSSMKWRAAVARLRSEPGLVVLRAERSFGRWFIDGLRDPLANDPKAVLAALSADTTSVHGHWETYLSFEPSILRKRATRVLSAPATVSFTLSGDTLKAAGSASAGWLSRARLLSNVVPGISEVDLSRVNSAASVALQSLADSVSQWRFLFAVGSSELDDVAIAGIAECARQIDRLLNLARTEGLQGNLELTGRTDPTGTEETNRNLSGRRADRVLTTLAIRGIPRDRMRPVAAGFREPLAGVNAAETARINRSVTIGVTFNPESAVRQGQ